MLFAKSCVHVISGDLSHQEASSNVDMILERLPGALESKKATLREWDKKASPDTILATTVSGGISEIAAAIGRPQKVVGLNFVFDPFEGKCLVQIVRGLDTSDETIQKCSNLTDKARVVSIVV